MVSLEDANSYSHSHSHTISNISNSTTSARFQLTRPYYYTPSPSYSSKIQRSMGRSMRTIRSTFFQTDDESSGQESANMTDSDIRLGELTTKPSHSTENSTSNEEFLDMSRARIISDFSAYSSDVRLEESTTEPNHSKKNSISNEDFLDMSRTFSDFSAYSSDISGELERLASVPDPGFQNPGIFSGSEQEPDPQPCHGFLERESFSTEIIEHISPEDLQPTVKLCVDGLNSSSLAIKRSAAGKLRLLAKNRAENRALIGECGAISLLVPLLRCSDPLIQENAVTALLNLSLHDDNKRIISNSAAIKSFIYVLRTGTDTSKQNAACALLSLALVDESKVSIGACGAIPPLVALLISGTNRGKKDALTTLYKLCSVKLNKEKAVSAGAVRPLVAMVMENGPGMAEKAMVVLSSLATVEMGRDAIVEEGGIGALVEAIDAGSGKGREFAVLTLLQMCAESFRNRNLLVREGGIPPLVALSQNGSAKAKHKAEKLLGYLREPRQEASTSTS